MEQLILIIHVLAALGIVALILIQQGKGADMGASFGAGASQTLFGSAGGGNVLTKSTAILATIFFATSFGLAVIAKEKSELAGGADIDLPTAVETIATPEPAGDIPNGDAANASAAGSVDIPELDMSAQEQQSADIPDADVQSQILENTDIPSNNVEVKASESDDVQGTLEQQ